MTTPTVTSSNDSQMHNNIMAADSRDRPPMLVTGRYPQWRSQFLRYIDTRPNGEALKKCILSGPYKPTTILVQGVDVTDDPPAVPEHTTVETPMNMSPENKARFEAEKEAIHLILTEIGDEIYSTVDACQTTQEMWEAIERSHTATRHKGKEIAKPITLPSETASEEDSNPEQAQRDKDMQKNLAFIAKYFKKIYKPTNNNLKTSSNLRNKNVDTTPRYKNDNQSGQFGNQRTINVAGARENVDSPVVQQSGIQCFNCKEFRHFSKECRKPKSVKDSAYHKEKMLLYKQAEQGVPLQVEQYDWLENTNEEVDKHELEAHYNYMAKIQEVLIADSGIDSEPLEQTKQVEFEKYKAFNDRTVDYDKLEQIVDNAWIKHSKDQFRAPTAQDMEIQIQTCLMPLAIKTQNDSFRFVHELKQEMHADLKYVESLEKEIDELEPDKAEFSDMYDVILQECVSNDVKYSYLMSLSYLDALDELQCLYLDKVKECECIAQKLSKQTESVSKAVHNDLLQRFAKVEKHSISLEIALSTQIRAPQLPQTVRNTKPRVSTSTGVNHKTNVSKPQHKINQSRDKVVPNNSQVKVKKTQVEVHSRIPSVSHKMKSVTACKDSLNSRTLNANVVCATCKKCLVDSNHFACVTKMLNDVNARTKKHTVVPIITRKPKSQANKLIATPYKKKVASKSTNQKPQSYYKMLNDQFAPIPGYGDLVQGNVTIKRVYYIEGLNHNLFSVGQFCEADLEVAFRKSTCFVRDLQGNDLLTGNRGSDLYIISLQESTSSTPLYLMAKASPTQAWLWHQRLSHINFDYINLLLKKDVVIGLPKLKYVKDQLCSSCELSKAKRSSFKSKVVPSSKGRLNLLYMDLCGLMRVASINEKKYILVIVDDYSRYTWTLFLHSKDETPEVLKEFLTMTKRNLQAPVITV
nr:retrovirus-related Pol polyprotein from transposon TNT 1-94 [Tanacetum cinerariifolium]